MSHKNYRVVFSKTPVIFMAFFIVQNHELNDDHNS